MCMLYSTSLKKRTAAKDVRAKLDKRKTSYPLYHRTRSPVSSPVKEVPHEPHAAGTARGKRFTLLPNQKSARCLPFSTPLTVL